MSMAHTTQDASATEQLVATNPTSAPPDAGQRARVPCPSCTAGEMGPWTAVMIGGAAARLGEAVLFGRTCSRCSRVHLGARSQARNVSRDAQSSLGASVLQGLVRNVVTAFSELLSAARSTLRR
jgi:hypothetical protein